MITSLGQLRWISYCANTAYFMSVKIGTTPETPVKSRLSCVVPIIYHSHALHDTAGGGQQLGIRHLQHQVPGIVVAAVQPQDLHLILSRVAAVDGGQYGGRAAFDLPGRRHRDGLGLVNEPGVRHLAEDAAVGVGRQGAHVTLHGEITPQARPARPSGPFSPP